MIINIPIVYGYYLFVDKLTNTIRITFINKTHYDVINLNILGCDSSEIKKITPGEKETVWLKIHGDCSVFAEYSINGTERKEQIVVYATNGLGTKMDFFIYSVNKSLQ
jgi:hypothetical protein